MSHRRLFGLASVLAFALSAVSVHAAPPEHKGRSTDGASAMVNSNVDYDAIRAVAVAAHYTGYKALPPGIAKNLARGKPLPPGIAKKTVPTPVLEQLPMYPNHEWTRCGADLVLVDIATRVVVDVLTGIFR